MRGKDNSEVEHARREGLKWLMAGSAGFILGAMLSGEASAQRWNQEIWIDYNSTESLIPTSGIEPLIEYAAWALTARARKPAMYVGTTFEKGGKRSRRITIKWESSDRIQDMTGNGFSTGASDWWWYQGTNQMSGAIVYLNRATHLEADQCLQNTIMHEVMHASGYGRKHSANRHDVMYISQVQCRYALSAADVRGLPYGESLCWAELTPDGDLYVPHIRGMAALLKRTGEQSWELDQYEPATGNCSSVEVLEGKDLILHDVRRRGERYYAELENTGGDTWSLHYAE